MANVLFMEGQKFGKFTVMRRLRVDHKGRVYWLCVCECGKERSIRTDYLRKGKFRCGNCSPKITRIHKKKCPAMKFIKSILRDKKPKPIKIKEIRTTPKGLTKQYPREYQAWSSAIQRCENPKNPHYKYYGLRGIAVDPAWRKSFHQFLIDMGPRPGGLTLERKNNDKGYSADNCKWATFKEQALNTRSTRKIVYKGKVHKAYELLESLGLTCKWSAIKLRMGRGVSLENIIDGFVKGNTEIGKLPSPGPRLKGAWMDNLTIEYFSLPKANDGRAAHGALAALCHKYNVKDFSLIRRAQRHLNRNPHLSDLIPCNMDWLNDCKLEKPALSKRSIDILEQFSLKNKEDIKEAIESLKLEPAVLGIKNYGIRSYTEICKYAGVEMPILKVPIKKATGRARVIRCCPHCGGEI